MKISTTSVLVPSISVITGLAAFLVLSGIVIQGFNPLVGVVEATSYGSFNHLTNILYYETTEVSYNMEDKYNSTHLNDFSSHKHFGNITGALQFESGMYGESLEWQTGQIIGEDLDIKDQSFTLEAWIYPTSEESTALAGCEAIYPYIWKAQNGSMLYQYSGGLASFYSNQSVELNAWTHVSLAYDAVSGVAKWYLNATEHGSKLIDSSRDWDGRWSIGRMRPDYNAFEWKGKVDEFRIYKGEARTQREIQEDMRTSIARKLILTGLTPNSDVVQLSYPNGEFARIYMLQQTADENGQVEFSVYSFSGRSTNYTAVLKVLRPSQTYSSKILEFSWEDVYHFSVRTPLTETTIAALVTASIIIIPSALMIVYRYQRRRREPS